MVSPIPPGTYAGGGRSPIAWVYLCPPCGGYATATDHLDHRGALFGQCGGCGSYCWELHRFRAFIDSASGCGCTYSHERRTGDLSAAAGACGELLDAICEALTLSDYEPGDVGHRFGAVKAAAWAVRSGHATAEAAAAALADTAKKGRASND